LEMGLRCVRATAYPLRIACSTSHLKWTSRDNKVYQLTRQATALILCLTHLLPTSRQSKIPLTVHQDAGSGPGPGSGLPRYFNAHLRRLTQQTATKPISSGNFILQLTHDRVRIKSHNELQPVDPFSPEQHLCLSLEQRGEMCGRQGKERSLVA